MGFQSVITGKLTGIDTRSRRNHDHVAVCRRRDDLLDQKRSLQLHHRVIRILRVVEPKRQKRHGMALDTHRVYDLPYLTRVLTRLEDKHQDPSRLLHGAPAFDFKSNILFLVLFFYFPSRARYYEWR